MARGASERSDEPEGPPWAWLIPIGLLSLVPAIYGSGQDQVAPWLTLTGVPIVACITWLATDRRQQIALREEAKRQQQTLSHNRDLAELADFRLFLDGMAAVYERARDAIIALGTYRERPYVANDYGHRRAAAHECEVAVYEAYARLLLRLPPDHEAVCRYESIRTSIFDALAPFPTAAPTIDAVPTETCYERRLDEARREYAAFAQAVRALLPERSS